jgi:hypothetical protein
MKKWLYPLLIVFVAFFIFSNPARAGTQARGFVIWLGDLAAAAGEFLDGLFDQDNQTSNGGIIQPNGGDSATTIIIEPVTPTTAIIIDGGGGGDGDLSDGFGQTP